MVIDYLDVDRTWRPVRPFEADSPLVVDPNAVLPLPIALQDLKPVSWQDRKVPYRGRCFELIQFHLRLAREARERLYLATFGKLACALVSEAHDHGESIATA